MDIWATREHSLKYLRDWHPSRLDVLMRTFELIDECIDAFEGFASDNTYARACGLSLLKLKNLAVGSYSLILDGLGQETGALMRPMIEYAELLTYFRMFPKEAEKAADNNLPQAGVRAKAIGGIYKEFREHLNEHASHSSFSHFALAHLLEPGTLRFKKSQKFVPNVLDANVRDLTVQLQLMLREAVLAIQPLEAEQFLGIAENVDKLNARMMDVFGLNEA